FNCDLCPYSTQKSSDIRRHQRVHKARENKYNNLLLSISSRVKQQQILEQLQQDPLLSSNSCDESLESIAPVIFPSPPPAPRVNWPHTVIMRVSDPKYGLPLRPASRQGVPQRAPLLHGSNPFGKKRPHRFQCKKCLYSTNLPHSFRRHEGK